MKLRTILIVSFGVLTVVVLVIWLTSTSKKSLVGTTQQPTTSSVGTTQQPTQSTTSAKPPAPVVAPLAVRVIDAAVLVGVLPDAIDVTIESDEPDLRRFSGTYYYSFSVDFDDPKFRTWAWTLDSVAAPGGNGYRGETRAQLAYGNEDGKWDLTLNTGDPYPEPPVLLRATTGPLNPWSSVWGAKWTRVEPLGTTDSKRPLVMPLIKVSARGTGVIALWT